MDSLRFGDGRDWFFEARYGMFIHWGLYAIPAIHEQIWWRCGMAAEDYTRLIDEFDPVDFDPEAWVELALRSGMKYLVFTTKHHDGFCLWDTQATDFKVTNSPFARDICAELAEACHRRGLPLCWYYSVVDWHQPNYPNQGRSHELPGPKPGDTPDLHAYLDFVRTQIRELCTGYSPIHAFWWDVNVTDHTDPSFNALIRELQPQAVINNRGFDPGDFGTPERENEHDAHASRIYQSPIEVCNALGVDSWGFREHEDFYTPSWLMLQMAQTLAKGGNYLLNVSPDARGVIQPKYADRLAPLARWLDRVGEAFFGTEPAGNLIDDANLLATQRGETTRYIIQIAPLMANRMLLAPMQTQPRRVTCLNDGSTIPTRVHWLPQQYWKTGLTPFLTAYDLPIDAHPHEPLVLKIEC